MDQNRIEKVKELLLSDFAFAFGFCAAVSGSNAAAKSKSFYIFLLKQ